MRLRTIGTYFMAMSLAIAAAGSAAAAPPVDAFEEARPLRMFLSGQFGRLLQLRSELDLSDEQRTEIREIVKSHKSEIAAAMKPVVEKRRALREATLAETPNEQAIRTAAADLGKALGDVAVVGAKIKAEVREVLTPEQREKIKSHRTEADAAVDQFIDEAAKRS